MKLTLAVFLVVLTAEIEPAHRQHRRNVPGTSYFRGSPGAPRAGYGAVANATISIIKQTEENSYDGQFSYRCGKHLLWYLNCYDCFQTDNGISVEVRGSQKRLGPNEEGQVMEGRYSYTAPDGTPVSVQWTADETGFHATTGNKPTGASARK